VVPVVRSTGRLRRRGHRRPRQRSGRHATRL